MTSVRKAHAILGSWSVDQTCSARTRPRIRRQRQAREPDRDARPVHPADHLERRKPRKEDSRLPAPQLPALDEVEDREHEGKREGRVRQDRQRHVQGEERAVGPLGGRRARVGQQQPRRRRQHDERDQEGPDRALAVPGEEDEEGDAEHPAEQRHGAAERPVGHGAEQARPVHEVRELEDEAARNEHGRELAGSPAGRHQRDDGERFRAEVKSDRRPAEQM